MQLITAGKAHPADQDLILQWIRYVNHTEARSHVAFLSYYEMHQRGPRLNIRCDSSRTTTLSLS